MKALWTTHYPRRTPPALSCLSEGERFPGAMDLSALGVRASHNWWDRLSQQAETLRMACEPGYQDEDSRRSYFGSWLYRRIGWCRSQRHALTGSYLTSLWVPKMQTFGDSLKPLLHLVPTVFLRGREKVVIFFSFLHFLFYFLHEWIISSGKNLMLSTSLLMELRKISCGTILGVSETLSGIKLRANSFPFQNQNLKKKT